MQPKYDVSRWEKKKGDSVKFSCKVIVEKVDSRTAENGNLYWVIKSSLGTRFVCFKEELVEQINRAFPGEKISIRGRINFVMGSTYLNVTEIITLSVLANAVEQDDFYCITPQGNVKEGENL